MAGGVFVTGTDTGVGKTTVACGLLRAAAGRGVAAAGFKPVASGCRRTGQGWRNDDAEALLAESVPGLPYEVVNPYALPEPVAPHLAAAQAGVTIVPLVIQAAYQALRQRNLWLVAEGVGGWRVPLADGYTSADLARDLGLPVLLVVGLRLGCLNHALLTAEAVSASGLPLGGWVGVAIDSAMARVEENLETLARLLPGPCLGVVPHLADPDPASVSAHLKTRALFVQETS